MHHAMYQEIVSCRRDGDEKEIRHIVSTGITPAILVETACDFCNWSSECKECLAESKTKYAKANSLISR